MALPVVVRSRPVVVRSNRPVGRQYVLTRRPSFVTPPTPWSPVSNVTSTDEAYTIDVEVPGLKRSDVTIELAEKTLTVSGNYGSGSYGSGSDGTEKAPEVAEDEATEVQVPEVQAPEPAEPVRPARTLRTGSFEFRRTLPADVEREGVTATLADGVLTLVLPRAAQPAARRVEITEG